MTASFILAAGLFVAGAVDGEGAEARPFHEIQRDVTQLLKAESQVKEPAAQAAVVRQMCQLHGEIVGDARYATSDVLKQYRGQLWSRLTKIKTALKRQQGRDTGGRVAIESQVGATAADAVTQAAMASLADSLALFDRAQSGPAQWVALGGGPVAGDFGPDLVELIERTIEPTFWAAAGGPGTIVYFQPLQCLVVRATSEVHGRIGGVVGELRK